MHNMNAAKQLSHTIKLRIIQPIFVRATADLATPDADEFSSFQPRPAFAAAVGARIVESGGGLSVALAAADQP